MSRRARLVGPLLGAALWIAATPGCKTQVGRVYEAESAGMPPLAQTALPPSYLTPLSQRFRVAVLSFIDQTDRAELVTEPLADVLTTALFETSRFNLYDRRDLKTSEAEAREAERDRQREEPPAEEAVAPRGEDERNRTQDPLTQYDWIKGAVDGILQGYVTAIETRRGGGSVEADYRIVNPDTGLVVFSDSGRVRFKSNPAGSSVSIVREDVEQIARSIARSFVDLDALASQPVRVTDVQLAEREAQITLNVGADENNIKQGFAGFVVEEDERTQVIRYLAKFVIVNVFPEASVGVVVPHCNNLRSCMRNQDAWVTPPEQVRSVRVGSSVRLK